MAWLDLAGFLSGFWLDLALVWVGSGWILGLVLALVSVGFGLIWLHFIRIWAGFGLDLGWIGVGYTFVNAGWRAPLNCFT